MIFFLTFAWIAGMPPGLGTIFGETLSLKTDHSWCAKNENSQ